MANSPSPALAFTETELALLARTADALTAYTGKPVLAETGVTDGVPWVVFGVPVPPNRGEDDDADDGVVIWKMGEAPGVRWVGNAGGLAPRPDEIYDCYLLWAIQLTAAEGERFVKLNERGEVVAWAEELADLLPFVIDGDFEPDFHVFDDEDDENDEPEEDERQRP